jgi:type VII secretion integral membrane protein EccD
MTAPVGAGMGAGVGVGLARVTVAAPTRRIDVALPEDSPVAELLPHLLRHAGEGAADEGDRHGGWVLRRAGGVALEPASGLLAQGVRDGDVLHLVPRRLQWPELEYDDVVEAIAGGARRYGRSWGNVATRRCGLAAASAIFALGLVVLLLARPPWAVAGTAALLVAFVFTLVGATLSRAMADAVAGAVVAGCGLPYAFLGGFLLFGPAGGVTRFGAPQVLLGSVVLLVFGVVGYFAVTALPRLFAAGVVVGLLGGLGGLLGYTSLPADGAAAIVVTIAIGLMPGYPLLAVRLGKLPVPALPQRTEELLADRPAPRRADVFAAVVRSDELLTGMLLGAAVLSMAGMALLVAGGRSAGAALVLVALAALLLRSRLFPTPRQRIPLIVTGIAGAGLVAVAVAATSRSALAVPLVLLCTAAAGALVLVAGLLYSRRAPSPYLGRLADVLDVLAIVALVPVTCVVCGLYGSIQGLFAALR